MNYPEDLNPETETSLRNPSKQYQQVQRPFYSNLVLSAKTLGKWQESTKSFKSKNAELRKTPHLKNLKNLAAQHSHSTVELTNKMSSSKNSLSRKVNPGSRVRKMSQFLFSKEPCAERSRFARSEISLVIKKHCMTEEKPPLQETSEQIQANTNNAEKLLPNFQLLEKEAFINNNNKNKQFEVINDIKQEDQKQQKQESAGDSFKEEGLITDSYSTSNETESDSDSDSSLSEGILKEIQLPKQILDFRELDCTDSFTTDDSSQETVFSELSSYKACNKPPSIVSFLIVTQARNHFYVDNTASVNENANPEELKSHCDFNCLVSLKKPRLTRTVSFDHFRKAQKSSQKEILGTATDKKCHCCNEKVFNQQDVACFSICEHQIHEYCLMELIEAHKYKSNKTTKRDATVFCLYCAQISTE